MVRPSQCVVCMPLLMASSWFCSISGNKATKAREWSIPVVNHTWLEDCFIRWKKLSVGLEKYVAFPPGLDFSNHLGERSIQREVILEGLPDLIAEIALSQGKVTSVGKVLDHHDGGNPSRIATDMPSTRTAQEMADITGRSETEHPMDVDSRSEGGAREEHMQADGRAVSPGLTEPKRAGRSSRWASEGSSSLRQAVPSRQRTQDSTSTSKRRPGVDPQTSPQTPLPSQPSTPTSLPSLTITPASTTPPASPLTTLETSKEDVPSPTKRESAPITTGSFVGGPLSGPPRQTSPSKSRATTPLPGLDSVVTTPSTRRTPRRSAANKAIQRLREEVIPDLIDFEKEMRRGQVRAANLSPKSEEMAKTRLLAKPLSKAKKRLSIQPATALGDVGSSDEHDHERRRTKKRRRPSRVKSHHDRFEDSDDDGRTDIAGKGSQGSAAEIPSSKCGGAGKGPEVKEGDSQSGQVDSFHSSSP
jgi:mediator of DNA damage checkpoint protein 1